MTVIVRGIDVSGHTSITSWGEPRKQKIQFVIIKASEGVRTVSRVFPARWQEAKAHGYLCGTYHFAHPYNRAEDEAEFYVAQLRKVGWQPRYDLPPVLDIEKTEGLTKVALTAWCLKFLTTVDKMLDLKEQWLRCGIYCNTEFYNNRMDGKRLHDGRWLWHASWPKSQKDWPTTANSMSLSSAIWQWRGNTIVNGASPVDLNIARVADLQRLAPLHYEGDTVSLTTDEIRAIARAVLNEPLIDMTDVAEKYGYTKHPPIYSLRQIASDAAWNGRAINKAFKLFAESLEPEMRELIADALESGILDVAIQFREKTDTETTP